LTSKNYDTGCNLREDKELFENDPDRSGMAHDKSLGYKAAYTLLLLTAASIATVFWLVLSDEGAYLLRPTAMVAVGGLTGGLLCVATRDTRSFEEGGWVQAVYSWLLTAFAGASTSLLVFFLATLAFLRVGEFHYVGLGELGVVTGYLGASVAMTGALDWGPSLKSPLDRVNREIDLQLKRILPSLQPRVNRLMEEAILGPPIPSYNGYVAVMVARAAGYPMPVAAATDKPGVSFAVWFDTVPPDVNPAVIPDASQSQRRVYPVIVRGRGSLVGTDHDVIQLDVLFHISTMRASPIRNTISVPLSGRSITLPLLVPSADLPFGLIPPDSLIELRCRGALIQMINLEGAGGFANG
jgi:hypothetical protein